MIRDLAWCVGGLLTILAAIIIGLEGGAWLGAPKLALLIAMVVLTLGLVGVSDGGLHLLGRMRRHLRARRRVPRARVIR